MPDSAHLWAYLNGTLVRGKDATVSLFERGILWGDGVDTLAPAWRGTAYC